MAYLIMFRAMWLYAGRDRWKVAGFVTAHLLSHAQAVCAPLVFGAIINTIQRQPPDLLRQVSLWLTAYVGLFFWNTAFHRLGRYWEFQVSLSAWRRFLNQHYTHIASLPLQWHTDHHSGDTINRLNKAAKALRDYIEAQFVYIADVAYLLGPLIALTVFSWPIALIALGVSLAMLMVIRIYDGKLKLAFDITNRREHRLAAALYDYIGNMKTVVILRLGSRTVKEIDRRAAAFIPTYFKAQTTINGFKWFFVPLLDQLLTSSVIFVYVWRTVRSGTPVMAGNLTAIYQYLRQLSAVFSSFAVNYQTIVAQTVDMDAARSLMEATSGVAATTGARQDWQTMRVSGLRFAYPQGGAGLQDVTLDWKRGEKIALVGSSGAGKSTLMALLRGLYTPQAGDLSIDGAQPTTLAPLATLATLIPQEPEIFENTLRYNIAFGLDFAAGEIAQAVELARFAEVAARLPQGLDTDVRERGVSLSGGERQRLALARGILAAADSSLILLDEPTSSVDMANEVAIYEGLFTHFTDRTIIASIHRLHLLNRFDRVIVMDQGRMVQTGTFDELKSQDGTFKQLWEQAT